MDPHAQPRSSSFSNGIRRLVNFDKDTGRSEEPHLRSGCWPAPKHSTLVEDRMVYAGEGMILTDIGYPEVW